MRKPFAKLELLPNHQVSMLEPCSNGIPVYSPDPDSLSLSSSRTQNQAYTAACCQTTTSSSSLIANKVLDLTRMSKDGQKISLA